MFFQGHPPWCLLYFLMNNPCPFSMRTALNSHQYILECVATTLFKLPFRNSYPKNLTSLYPPKRLTLPRSSHFISRIYFHTCKEFATLWRHHSENSTQLDTISEIYADQMAISSPRFNTCATFSTDQACCGRVTWTSIIQGMYNNRFMFSLFKHS